VLVASLPSFIFFFNKKEGVANSALGILRTSLIIFYAEFVVVNSKGVRLQFLGFAQIKMNKEELTLLAKAYSFAANAHVNQRRKNQNQDPYINHPIEVARILIEEGGVTDVNVIIAGICHDCIEDTSVTPEEIKEHFGEKICSIVMEVTDDKKLPKDERKQLQIVNAPHKSHEAKLVKLADKLHNLRSIKDSPPVDWDSSRIQEYFVWASKVIAGLRGTNEIIEHALDVVLQERIPQK
jgi:(p)ppGpp synthase/HD superfamily hydrolase